MNKIIFTCGFMMAINIIFCQLMDTLQSFLIPLIDWKFIRSAICNQYADYFSLFVLGLWLLLKYQLEGFRFNSFLIIIAQFFFYIDKVFQLQSILSNVSAIFAILYLWSAINQKHFSLPSPKGRFRTCYSRFTYFSMYYN